MHVLWPACVIEKDLKIITVIYNGQSGLHNHRLQALINDGEGAGRSKGQTCTVRYAKKKKHLKQTTRAYTRKNSKEILVSCIPCIRVFTTVQPKIQLPAFAIRVPRDKVQTYLMKTVKLITWLYKGIGCSNPLLISKPAFLWISSSSLLYLSKPRRSQVPTPMLSSVGSSLCYKDVG